jgi:hypothetical protein
VGMLNDIQDSDAVLLALKGLAIWLRVGTVYAAVAMELSIEESHLHGVVLDMPKWEYCCLQQEGLLPHYLPKRSCCHPFS